MVKSRILSLTSKEVIVPFIKGNSKGALPCGWQT